MAIAAVVAVLLVVLYLLYAGLNNETKTPLVTNEEPAPAVDEADERVINANQAIIAAVGDFRDLALERPELVLCSGGFINTEEPELGDIADQIISNRILQTEPLQYAITQDEAGIKCAAADSEWVLATALNGSDANNGRDFYCVDDKGMEGQLWIEEATMQCI